MLQDTKSNYDTDIFGPLLAAVHDLVGGGWRVQCISVYIGGMVHPQQILPSFHRMVDLLTNGWREFLSSMSFNSVEVEDADYTTGCAMSMSCHLMPFMSARRLHLELFGQYRRSLSGQSGQWRYRDAGHGIPRLGCVSFLFSTLRCFQYLATRLVDSVNGDE